MPLNSISNAIKNVHDGVSLSLEKLDPRFTILTNYHNGETSYLIKPTKNNDVQVKFSIEMGYEQNKHSLENLFKHGEPISLKNISKVQTDSELINYFFNNQNLTEIFISPAKKTKAHIQFFVDDEDYQGEHIHILEGEITHGMETFSFFGSISNILNFGLTQLPINLDLVEDNNTQKISLSLNFEQWEDCELRSIKDIEEVFNFLRLLNHKNVHAKLFIDDYQFASASVNSSKRLNSSNILLYLSYILKASKICKILNYPAYLPKDCTIIMEEYHFISEVYENLVKKRVVRHDEILSKPTMTFLITEDNFDIFKTVLESPRADYEFRLVNEEKTYITIFNQSFELPPIEWYFHRFKVKLNKPSIKCGDNIKMTFIPYKKSNYTIRYRF